MNRVGASRRGYSEEEIEDAANEMSNVLKGDKSTDNPISKSIQLFIKENLNTLTKLKQ